MRRTALVGTLLLCAAACTGRAAQDELASRAAPLRVVTSVAQAAPGAALVELAGVLEPERRVVLASKLPARIEALHVEEGQRVERNAILLRLDARDLSARREQLAAGRASALAQASWSEHELERTRGLTQSGALPANQLVEMVRVHDVAQASLSSVDAQLLELEVNLADANLRAPFSGVVVRRLANVGHFAAPGQPLLIVEDDSTLRLSVAVSDAEASSLVVGQRVPLRTEARTAGEATVRALVSSGDSAAPGQRLVALLDNADHAFRAGSIACIGLPSSRGLAELVSVPTSAVQLRGALPGVWVVRDERLLFAWVRIAQAHDATTLLASGVDANELVVRCSSEPGLRDGLRVVAANE